MTFDDTRDNATDIEDTIIEADDRADYDADDIEEDDGQPDEYTEWQDYFGGDEYYDHSENGGW